MRVRFGAFVFDSATRQVLHDERPVHLSPKSFDLLQILIERRPALVTKSELQDRLWPDTVVLEANLGNATAEIRKALGDNPKSPKYIATVSRRGYRFCADLEEVGDAGATPAHRSFRWWLTWKDIVLPLSEGENTVGRHPESDVWIDASSVSRVHARIVVAAGRASVEDRGSTNGTSVNGTRIWTPHPLLDGTGITFGSERVVFREWLDDSAPPTEPVGSGPR
ncbi:MAG TPA: FHA domain-containing protein [Vicinamibacterales bacterium]|nr:FHA domain-containing protein [Vicinamibacterales bacterium]